MVGRIQIQIVFLFFSLNLLFLNAGCRNQSETTDLFYYATDSVKSGDIILRRGYGMISDFVVAKLNDSTNISHCGILVRSDNEELYVIHSLSKLVSDYDGVQICKLEDFLAESRPESVKVVRYKQQNTQRIAELAYYYLEQKTSFDEVFNIQDSTAFFCSELPIHIIKLAYEHDISQQASNPKFSIFLNENYFEHISFMQKKHLSIR